MKATINESGTLVIEAETGLETFALKKWSEGIKWDAASAFGVRMWLEGAPADRHSGIEPLSRNQSP
ncbi:hypothetical protein [Paraburkholderia phosphatilytica]|uniref:hypothetical protein n=1 Tax=Paraburkholderia phosphatilytica TaxID=2282883 RepID=UPI000E533BF9|nr:hypothetical protein [Paraburkholderia phosphatilytica]